MTEFFPQDYERNQDPRRIQHADQAYAEANLVLTQIISGLRRVEPEVYAHANDDASVLFDYLKAFIRRTHSLGGEHAIQVTTMICAVALTKLVRAPRTETNPLAHLERELNQDDDHS